MDQIQTIQPLMTLTPVLPSRNTFPLQQRQGFAPVASPVSGDGGVDTAFSSSIINVGSGTINTFSGVIPATVVTTSPFFATTSNVFIGVNNIGLVPFSVVLPANPVTGQTFIVKDVSGTAELFPITITAIGHTIDGSPSATINTNYGSVTLVFNGTDWSIV